MKAGKRNFVRVSGALWTAVLASAGIAGSAQADLVLEGAQPQTVQVVTQQPPVQYVAQQAPVQVVQASAPQPVQVIQAQPQYVQSQPVQVVQAQPQVVQNQPQYVQNQPLTNNQNVYSPRLVESEPSANPSQDMSQSELMRRERVRVEVKNEDILSQRLEELRLREERRRTDQLLGQNTVPVEMAPPVAVQPAPVMVQQVGQLAVAQPVVVSTAEVLHVEKPAPAMKFGMTPRAGVSGFLGLSGFNVTPRFSLGGAISLEFNEYVALELGYTYNESGVQLASSNPWVNYIQQYASTAAYNPNFSTYMYRQHIADASAKVYVLGSKFRLRPFITAGMGYAHGMMNYDRSIVSAMQQYGMGSYATSYDTDSFLGQVGAGLDIVVSKNVSIGAGFKYNHVLATRENAPLYGPAFGGYGPGFSYGGMSPYGYPSSGYGTGYGAMAPSGNQVAAQSDPSKAFGGGSLGRTGFFNVEGHVTLSF